MEKDLENRGIDEEDRPEGSSAKEGGLLSDLTASASGATGGDTASGATGGDAGGDESETSLTEELRTAKDSLLGRDVG